MKTLTLALTLVSAAAMAQDYAMFETQYLKILPGHSQQFGTAMKAHNDQFHSNVPYNASVYYVVNGPRAGQMFWVMGPLTFSDFDNRPSSAEHLTDWNDEILASSELTDSEHWRLDEELSYNTSMTPPPLYRVRIFDIVDGEDYRFDAIQRKIKEVFVAKNRKGSRAFYRNVSASGTGREIAIVTTYEKWADLDAATGAFPKDYDEVHGEGAFASFVQERKAVVKQDVDEFHEYIPELSATPPATSNQ